MSQTDKRRLARSGRAGERIMRAATSLMMNIDRKIVPADPLEEGAMPKFLQENSLQENLTRRLCDSVDRLQQQMETVEFWASAVRGLVAPIPDYQPDDAAIA